MQEKSFLDKFGEKLMPIANKLNSNRYLAAIRDGFFASMSIIIVGSVFLIFPNFPYQGFINFMNGIFGSGWVDFCNRAYDMSVNVMTIYVVIGISRSLARHYKIATISAVVPALMSFLLLTPEIHESAKVSGLPLKNFGASGLFLGMFCAIFSVEITRFVLKRGWKIKMPETVPSNVSASFESLIPVVFIFLIYLFIFQGFKMTSFGSAQNFIFGILQKPLQALGSSIGATVLIEVIATLLFSFGLHGPNIVGAITTPIWTALTVENSDAYRLHKALPNIVNSQFDSSFVKLGGCGATIGLVILLVFVAKSDQFKSLGKLSIGPAIFNINEPVIFGAPIVLNPILMIPFILSPIIFATLSWIVMRVGLVPITNGINLPWTMPLVFSGFLLSGWRGALWQIIEIFLSIAWYYPFFKIADKQAYKIEMDGAKAES
ncbi:PTS sugar transporter subunit IIC [Xylocopilactobacillus apicola]|uniref:Permease IIC component n=1 Tax=Xylocopilactobacillus apicola TaxID=2932184 RepID=A0AAU9D6T3_9LACO|nr:PTS sugar transporter subunit IIC [Xylocopilactobacillus apicola]BDR58010.1 permease IIC component [Xylocopilactobacillus apicola]